MSRGTVRIALLLLSALYVSAIRQPLAVLEPAAVDPTLVVPQAVVESVPPADAVVAQEAAVPLDPALINPVTPQAALEAVPADAVVAPEALPPLDPTAAAADVASVAIDSEVVIPVDAALPVDSAADDAGVSAQAATTSAVDAYGAGTLGVGYSGSGFLIMYHVGVSAILRALGFFAKTKGFAGASGGSVAAAYSCSTRTVFTDPQEQFRMTANTLLTGCRNTNNCLGTLDTAVRTGLSVSFLSLRTATSCENKLHIAVTRANLNSLSATARRDQPVFVNGTWPTTNKLVQAVAASSFIPRFSGASAGFPPPLRAVTEPSPSNILGFPVAYDGVATDPLPVPPSSPTRRITYTITVSAVVNETNASGPPTTVFDSLITTANDGCTRSTCDDAFSRPYMALDPVKVTQPASVDIYPGRSGTWLVPRATWNNFVLTVPTDDQTRAIYNQGREDARDWVRTTFAGVISDAQLSTAMGATVWR